MKDEIYNFFEESLYTNYSQSSVSKNPGSGSALTKKAGSGSARKLMRIRNTVPTYNSSRYLVRYVKTGLSYGHRKVCTGTSKVGRYQYLSK